ncbi:MAG: pseudouridine synthase [Thermovenabulum sp.]|uniref:pseudouridine synthase n=1 Tax=Thermovenabulum sp. TaxID=3100335 RepID=UPI003C7C2C43
MEKKERIDKILSMCGFGTRKDVKKIIKEGEVMVNGEVIKDAGYHVLPEVDEILVFGETLVFKRNIYIMLNKPKGVICATYDKKDKTVVDLLEGEYSHRNLFPVGRLDKDAEGLILLTDDGMLAHKLLSPKSKVFKEYYVEVEGYLTQEDILAFEKGIQLEDFKTQPAELTIIESNKVSKAKVKISEGKFHQIKRMFEALGKRVVYLKRTAIGALKLDSTLSPGEWRELTDEELKILKENVD